ncbi:MAG TPA: hypothetical protein VGA53_01915 [Candidatus Paceibacterota bacterium]
MDRLCFPKKELRHLYEKEKLTTYQIAKRYGCCQGTIWNRLNEYGIKTRFPWNATDLTKERLQNWYLVQKLSTWEIQKRYGYPRGTVHRKLREYEIRRRSYSESHIVYQRKDFDGSLQEKAYLIGFRIGDLRARRKGDTIHVDCASTKESQIKLIESLFRKYGHIWTGKPNYHGATQIEANLNLSFKFLLSKKTPRWIFRSKNYFAPFLAGFTDAEGCISLSDGMAYYVLGNYNYHLLFEIHNQLIKLGIQCPKMILSQTKGYVGKDGYGHNEDYLSLRISRKVSLLQLFYLIGPYIRHADKKHAIKRAQENIRLRNEKYGNINMEL